MPKKKPDDEESMKEEIGYKQPVISDQDMRDLAQMRADRMKTMKNKDSRLTERTRILLSDPEFFKKNKLKKNY